MKAYLLDTSVLLAHYKDEACAARVQSILDDDEAEVFIASLSITEFARRLLSLRAEASDARNTALEYAGIATQVVPVDTAVAVRAYELGALCKTRLPLIDTLIAACAATVNAILVHQDHHFSGLPRELVLQEELSRG